MVKSDTGGRNEVSDAGKEIGSSSNCFKVSEGEEETEGYYSE
jgi:hypothetical protein